MIKKTISLIKKYARPLLITSLVSVAIALVMLSQAKKNYIVESNLVIGKYQQRISVQDIQIQQGDYLSDVNILKRELEKYLSKDRLNFDENCNLNVARFFYSTRSNKYIFTSARGRDDLIVLKTVSNDLNSAQKCNEYLAKSTLKILNLHSDSFRNHLINLRETIKHYSEPIFQIYLMDIEFKLKYLDLNKSYIQEAISSEADMSTSIFLSFLFSFLFVGAIFIVANIILRYVKKS